jgi:hypothetical protein
MWSKQENTNDSVESQLQKLDELITKLREDCRIMNKESVIDMGQHVE